MKRNQEQLASLKRRRLETLAMNKCRCGNVSKLGEKRCSRCQRIHEEQLALLNAKW